MMIVLLQLNKGCGSYHADRIGGVDMIIKGVASINIDEKYYIIDVGYTLNCDRVFISRECDITVHKSKDDSEGLWVVIN